jgi:hypothetical protein
MSNHRWLGDKEIYVLEVPLTRIEGMDKAEVENQVEILCY